MVVSAQSVDDMSKQKATGGHGPSRAVVALHLSGRDRYIADHFDRPAVRCIPGGIFLSDLIAHAALVWQAIQGQWMSSCLGVLLELQIPDLLAKEDKPIALEMVGYRFASRSSSPLRWRSG